MNNEVHILNSKNFLDLAKEKLEAGEYDGAIAALKTVYSNVGDLLVHATSLKRSKVLDSQHPGMNAR